MSLNEFFEKLSNVEFGINDIFDIVIVAVLFFVAFRFVRDRRAGKLLIGIVFLTLLLAASNIFQMTALNFILESLFSVGLVALVVVFQPELRAALEKMGDRSVLGIKVKGNDMAGATEKCITVISDSCELLSKDRTGALIVFERSTKLGEHISSGTVIDAEPSVMLIGNIFFNKAPLHDGAVIIRDGRIFAAGCFLPLSSNPNIIKDLGTRHRAGMGMSENSDAVVVIVSEETGNISVAFNGVLRRDFTRDGLEKELRTLLGIEARTGKVTELTGRLRKLSGKGGDNGVGKKG